LSLPWTQVSYGAGAYICGEETALLESLEGKQVGDSTGAAGALLQTSNKAAGPLG